MKPPGFIPSCDLGFAPDFFLAFLFSFFWGGWGWGGNLLQIVGQWRTPKQSNDPEVGKQLHTIQATAIKACPTLQLRTPHLYEDLAARICLRTQNALTAYANTCAGPTRSLRKDCRTNGRKAKEANSFILDKQH